MEFEIVEDLRVEGNRLDDWWRKEERRPALKRKGKCRKGKLCGRKRKAGFGENGDLEKDGRKGNCRKGRDRSAREGGRRRKEEKGGRKV